MFTDKLSTWLSETPEENWTKNIDEERQDDNVLNTPDHQTSHLPNSPGHRMSEDSPESPAECTTDVELTNRLKTSAKTSNSSSDKGVSTTDINNVRQNRRDSFSSGIKISDPSFESSRQCIPTRKVRIIKRDKTATLQKGEMSIFPSISSFRRVI